MDIRTIETPGLGDRSYVVVDGDVAVVIDPQRDIDRVLDAAGDARITHIFETHMHNDYVSGGLALAQQTGAAYFINADDEVAFDRTPVRDGDEISIGSMTVTAIHTPGHTQTHLSYSFSLDGEPVAVFTGGSMLFGAMGRTDLLGDELKEELTHAQYQSAHRLAKLLPDSTGVFPTHGFGSFCSATETKGSESTIGNERRQNSALTLDEQTFVDTLLAGLTAYPRYYAHMGPANRAGAGAPDISMPSEVDPATLRKRIEAGEWVVDLRSRKAYAAGHVPGTLSVELADPFATYLGWTIRWGTPLTLIGDSPEQVLEARRQLVRIGIDDLAGAAVGDPSSLSDGEALASYRVATFSDLSATGPETDGVTVLDVRRPDEWEESHVAGASHIPFYELEGREHEVPDGEVWVHCQSGYRASIAASLLDRAGRQVVVIDDEWENAAKAGLKVVPGNGQQ